MKQSFYERVNAYLKGAEVAPVPFTALKKFELAPGVITIYNTYGEWEAYFDRRRWKPTRPEFWIDPEVLYPPNLAGTDIGTLPGMCQMPLISNEEEMLRMAKRELTSCQPLTWFEKPFPI